MHRAATAAAASAPVQEQPRQPLLRIHGGGGPVALRPLSEIVVPPPHADEEYSCTFQGERFAFLGLKALLGAADHDKAGDRHAGLAARNEVEREMARQLLSDLTLRHLYERPLLTLDGRIDEVVRLSYDFDQAHFLEHLAHLTVGDLKDRLLACADSAEIARIGRSIPAVVAAALAKLCDVHELILIAKRIANPTRARTTLGLPGALSSRLQPNHPTDDPRGLEMLVYTGLSMASGDALIGLNPAIDTVAHVSELHRLLDRLRRETGAPTQICVLAHVRTQLECLAAGAPVEVLFQSLAGTERTNKEEFDIDVALLDRAWATMAERGALAGVAKQFTYFETGQGSEFSYAKHEGIDMTTTESLCYTLARRYDPFMVNNVTGFIGPETHYDDREMIVANLQDHFMGKLLGLPMGMAPCFTLHANITLEGQQMATQLLTAAGANYYMDVCLNTDRMLAYFDTSAHDDQSLREVHERECTPEYADWAIARGILSRDAKSGKLTRGPRWGDPTQFCPKERLVELSAATPSLYGLEHAGPRPRNAVSRSVRANNAWARRAVRTDLDADKLNKITPMRAITTTARNRPAHLSAPSLGARLSAESAAALSPETSKVQIVVADGLSAEAIHHNIPGLLAPLMEGLEARGITCGQPLLARFGRVKLAEHIAERLNAELVVMLIGERPGGSAAAACSMSAYLAYRVADEGRYEYTVVSNIYEQGLPPLTAVPLLATRISQILQHRAAGNRLEAILAAC